MDEALSEEEHQSSDIDEEYQFPEKDYEQKIEHKAYQRAVVNKLPTLKQQEPSKLKLKVNIVPWSDREKKSYFIF